MHDLNEWLLLDLDTPFYPKKALGLNSLMRQKRDDFLKFA